MNMAYAIFISMIYYNNVCKCTIYEVLDKFLNFLYL